MPATIEVQIRTPEGAIEEVFPIGPREDDADIARKLKGVADTYAGTGWTAYLVIPGMPDALVGVFHA